MAPSSSERIDTRIECFPASLCSWNYRCAGFPSGTGTIEYDWITEQGHIAIGQAEYEVRKHGPFSGRWTLEKAGSTVIAEAVKPSAMFRAYEVRGQDVAFTLKAETPFTRAFVFMEGDQLMGSIRPVHAFTRRAVMECRNAIAEEAQLFSFWLVGLLWKRAARNANASNGSAGAG